MSRLWEADDAAMTIPHTKLGTVLDLMMSTQNRIRISGGEADEHPNPKGSLVDEDDWQRDVERVLDPRNRVMSGVSDGGPSGMDEVQQDEAEVQRAPTGWAVRPDP